MGVKNLSSVVNQLDRFAKKVEQLPKRRLQAMARFAHSRVIELTPIDTGRLKSSWNLSLNAPNYETTPIGRRSVQTATAQAMASQHVVERLKAGDTIYISNGVEYADYVENGSPTTAPRKMMERTMNELVLRFNTGAI